MAAKLYPVHYLASKKSRFYVCSRVEEPVWKVVWSQVGCDYRLDDLTMTSLHCEQHAEPRNAM